MEFTKLWNKSYKDGALKAIAAHFGISTCKADRIRRNLNLPFLHDWKNHPGRKAFIKRIKRLYWDDERSTIEIGKIVGMSGQNINHILKKQGVTLRPQHVSSNLRLPTSNMDMTHVQLLKKIREMYVWDKCSAQEIARELKIDPATVRTKLKGMDIKLRHNQRTFKGGYPCQWCAKIMPEVAHNHGPRKQLYCDSTCKNRTKDYRRMKRGIRVSPTRLQAMTDFLKEAWGEKYEEAESRIMSAKPCIQGGKTPDYNRNFPNYLGYRKGIAKGVR